MGPGTQARQQAAPGVPAPSAPGRGRARSTPATRTDEELLERCRHGDEEAWGSLVGRYERLIFSVALRNGLTREDAADVTQTTFLAVLDAIDRLRADQSLVPWLTTVARRQSWRTRRRRDREEATWAIGYDEEPILDWERVAWLHEGLQQLDEPCRELLTALYFDPSSPSYAEIASRFDRPIGGIGPMRGRCLAHLRAILGDAVAD